MIKNLNLRALGCGKVWWLDILLGNPLETRRSQVKGQETLVLKRDKSQSLLRTESEKQRQHVPDETSKHVKTREKNYRRTLPWGPLPRA